MELKIKQIKLNKLIGKFTKDWRVIVHAKFKYDNFDTQKPIAFQAMLIFSSLLLSTFEENSWNRYKQTVKVLLDNLHIAQ